MGPMRKLFIILLISLLFACGSEISDTDDYQIEHVVGGIDVPWGMVWLPNGDMLVTERNGTLYRVPSADKKLTPIEDVPAVHAKGQGGLLDVELHPAYADNGWLYLSYSSKEGPGDGSNTTILRAKLDGDRLAEQQILYKAQPNSDRSMHHGSRIEFDDEGYLFFSVGDRGARDLLGAALLVDWEDGAIDIDTAADVEALDTTYSK